MVDDKEGLMAGAIKRWRRRHHVSREQIAIWADRSVSTVGRWERGLIEPMLSDVMALEKKRAGLLLELVPHIQHDKDLDVFRPQRVGTNGEPLSFGEQLKSVRDKMEIDDQTAAHGIGIAPHQLRRIEQNKNLSEDQIRAYAGGLGLEVSLRLEPDDDGQKRVAKAE